MKPASPEQIEAALAAYQDEMNEAESADPESDGDES